ncbi:hypothetical protein [uncultured Thiodictyon sp.]|uniref:hypothetical protein n=1 Tax=uncultured Thiodictyon sp. TaxID=1846217 RepID=UPI0025CCF161|nr:hypothetical protein [uncultured Thiodictyon sp.]
MNPQTTIRLYVVLLLTGLLLGGCSTVDKETPDLSLQAATSAYQSALRWGYFETAFGYLDPALRRGKGLPAGYGDLRLTSYEVVQPPMRTGIGEGTQIVAYDYLHEDRQVVKQLIDRQVWRYDPKIRNWWLVSGLPKFE